MAKKVSLNFGAEDVFCFKQYINALGNTNSELRSKLLMALKSAISNELTPIQKQVVELYYFENVTIPHIAEILAVNKSSVSRILFRARSRLERVLKYVFMVFS